LREGGLRASRSPLPLIAMVGLRLKIHKLCERTMGVNVEIVRGELVCLE
jgi:hypothetical protein